MEESVKYDRHHRDVTLHAGTHSRSRVITLLSGLIKVDSWSNACGRKSTIVIIEMVTLHASTCTRSRVITYTFWNHKVGSMEECMWKKEYRAPQLS